MNYLSDFGFTKEPVIALVLLYFALFVVAAGIKLFFYVLQAVGVYRMSRSCETQNAWYAFVPFFNAFAIGSLAGKYRGKNSSSAKVLGKAMVVFYTCTFVFGLLFIACVLSGAIDLLFAADTAAKNSKELAEADYLPLIRSFIPLGLMFISMLIYKVLLYISAWKIFSMFHAKNACLYTVLSVLFNFLLPIFLYSVRNNQPIFNYKDRFQSKFCEVDEAEEPDDIDYIK